MGLVQQMCGRGLFAHTRAVCVVECELADGALRHVKRQLHLYKEETYVSGKTVL